MSFDSQMISTCNILRRDTGAQDSYGNRPSTFAAVKSAWPCRLSWHRSRPTEYQANKKFAIEKRAIVFMRLPDTGVTEHDRIQIAGEPLLNVVGVVNPGQSGHHLELHCEIIKP